MCAKLIAEKTHCRNVPLASWHMRRIRNLCKLPEFGLFQV